MKNSLFLIVYFLFLPLVSYSQIVSHSFEDSTLTVFVKPSSLQSETDTIYPVEIPKKINFVFESVDSSCNLVLNTAPEKLAVEFSISNTNKLLYTIRTENWEEQLFKLSIQEKFTNIKRYSLNVQIISQSLLKKRQIEQLRRINDSITWLENHPKRLAHHQKCLEDLRKPQENLTEKDKKKIAKIHKKLDLDLGVELKNNVFIDMFEVHNTSWIMYLYSLQEDSTKAHYLNNLPDTAVWFKLRNNNDIHNYLYRFIFMYYPVVGITYEQAQAYCIWRGNKVSELLNNEQKKKYSDYEITVHYRLPTQEEWEYAATKDDLDKQFGGHFSRMHYTEKEKRKIYRSAKYYTNSTHTIKDVKSDIENYFESDTSYKELFNYKMKYQKPYFDISSFLDYGQLMTNWVYGYPPTNFGLYNIFGNVAEMTSEKGIAKGGSFYHTLEECAADKVQLYDSPQAWLGFRCVAEVIVRKKDGK